MFNVIRFSYNSKNGNIKEYAAEFCGTKEECAIYCSKTALHDGEDFALKEA